MPDAFDTKDIHVQTCKLGERDLKQYFFKHKADSTEPTYIKFEITGLMCRMIFYDSGSGQLMEQPEQPVKLEKTGPGSTMRVDLSVFIY